MYNIIYLAMNNVHFVKECAASICSMHYKLNQETAQYHITIYTNLVNEFSKYKLHELFSIEYVMVTDEMRRNWLGDSVYIYKLKIYVLLDFLQKRNESVIFLDCDTFLLGDMSELFDLLSRSKDTALMNYTEKTFPQLRDEKMHSNFHRLQEKMYYDFCQMSTLIIDNNSYEIKEDFGFWNSGVIGLNPEMKDRLADALILNDYILDNYKNITSEQIALSIALSQSCQILATDHIVYHYWFMKEVRYLVETALNMPVEFEKKHAYTAVADMLRKDTKITYEMLEEKTAYFLSFKDKIYLKGLYEILPSSCHIGRSLRSYV